ncbi:hypothetical protein QFC19_009474 [Naganishia cerealis]|uniref:Uncharacterized protein n=1 Tax=Naganishia cerealis TaxID=610337 RepID=A0ACC2UVB7_9TREE|nr:hypothetical protein QFC19_009474 [Naganishia cerealis]
MTVQQYRKQQALPPTPPASPPANHVTPTTSPRTSSAASYPRLSGSQQVLELPKGLRKKKGKRRKSGSSGAEQGNAGENLVNESPSQPLSEGAFQEKNTERSTSENSCPTAQGVKGKAKRLDEVSARPVLRSVAQHGKVLHQEPVRDQERKRRLQRKMSTVLDWRNEKSSQYLTTRMCLSWEKRMGIVRLVNAE